MQANRYKIRGYASMEQARKCAHRPLEEYTCGMYQELQAQKTADAFGVAVLHDTVTNKRTWFARKV